MSTFRCVTQQEMNDFVGVFGPPYVMEIKTATKVVINFTLKYMARQGIREFTTRDIKTAMKECNIINNPFLKNVRVRFMTYAFFKGSMQETKSINHIEYICGLYSDRISRHLNGLGCTRLGQWEEDKRMALWSLD